MTRTDKLQSLPLEDCMSAIIDYRGKTPRKTEAGIPLITAKIVKCGRIDKPREFIDPLEYDAWMSRGLPQVGDVVMTTEAPLGEIAQLTDDRIALAQRLILLRGKPDILDNSYLKYLMMSSGVQSQLRGRASGTTVVGIKQSELRKIVLSLPPINEQRSIVDVLGALDNKIEQNLRTSWVLERLARAIFRAWFVDFEPVKAKTSGATGFPSMPMEVFDKLPIRLVDTEIGPVPEGWAVTALTDLFEVNPPRALRKGELAPHLDMKNMPTDGHSPTALGIRPFGSGAKFSNGDTLVARITPCLENGKTAFVDFLDEGNIAWGSTEYIVLRPHSPIPPIFAYLLARTSEFRRFAIQAMTGTSGRQRVPFSALSHFNIASPCADTLVSFGNIVNPLIKRSSAATRESQCLTMIRDLLMPRLLSGELKVNTGGAH